jgi:hypothetical protein
MAEYVNGVTEYVHGVAEYVHGVVEHVRTGRGCEEWPGI